jgi:hypothetical protein
MTTIGRPATLMRLGTIVTMALGCATANRDTERDPRPVAIRSTPGPSFPGDPAALPPGRPSDALVAAEILSAADVVNATAYDAVARLRPTFLSPRDARTGRPASRGYFPSVFIDGAFSGGTEVLRQIPVSAVAELRYLRPNDAQLRYGPHYAAGIILVALSRRAAARR